LSEWLSPLQIAVRNVLLRFALHPARGFPGRELGVRRERRNNLTAVVRGTYESQSVPMNPSEPTPRQSRADSARAFSIMFFAVALLCLLLGWADGVRHGTIYLHIPETGGWLIATAIFGAIGAIFLVWSRGAKRA
jgi:hypothetical protein